VRFPSKSVRTISALTLALVQGGAARADEPGAANVKAFLADPGQLAGWLRARDPMSESARQKVFAARELGEQARVMPSIGDS